MSYREIFNQLIKVKFVKFVKNNVYYNKDN